MHIDAPDLGHAHPVVSQRQIGGDIRMPQARRYATERAVGDGMRVGAEDERAWKGVTLFREYDMRDALSRMEAGYALLFHPFARLALGHRVLRANGRIVVIENHDDRFGIIHIIPA